MCKTLLSVSFCVFLSILSAKCQMEEGAVCFSKPYNVTGICVNQRHCRSVLNDFRYTRNPQICSSGSDSIICCTDCELVDDISNHLIDKRGFYYMKSGRKAEDKCLEYATSLEYMCIFSEWEALFRYLEPEKKCFAYEPVLLEAGVEGPIPPRRLYPHMALLGYGESIDNSQGLCGGSIISDRFILTAAHCVSIESVGTVKYVKLDNVKGTNTFDKDIKYNVRRAIVHPEYKPPSMYNDIALLELDKPIKFSKYVLPACLNTGGSNELNATATGWGTLGLLQYLADILQVVDLEQFSVEECSAAYPPHRHLLNGYNHATQSCYGNRNNQVFDTCEGDSGGPLNTFSKYGTCVYNIIGVTSYRTPCGSVGNIRMYTKVEYFVPWIESIVWP